MRAPHEDPSASEPATITGLGAHRSGPWDGFSEDAVDERIRSFRVQKMRARLEICRIEGASLMQQLESDTLTSPVVRGKISPAGWVLTAVESSNTRAILQFGCDGFRAAWLRGLSECG